MISSRSFLLSENYTDVAECYAKCAVSLSLPGIETGCRGYLQPGRRRGMKTAQEHEGDGICEEHTGGVRPLFLLLVLHANALLLLSLLRLKPTLPFQRVECCTKALQRRQHYLSSSSWESQPWEVDLKQGHLGRLTAQRTWGHLGDGSCRRRKRPLSLENTNFEELGNSRFLDCLEDYSAWRMQFELEDRGPGTNNASTRKIHLIISYIVPSVKTHVKAEQSPLLPSLALQD
ncbi:uncharacterized protein LOC123797886 isoform X2 [Ursus americanus]|uniref:uncharacterized protein LOC123797886 isoform X2 n=1 Tax=Ursus americanus TaxID=9643 RepID=UPI001E67D091|nr:uncharacterized protein LOC123797886 isoform X2 [Ursus americanus]